MVHRLLVGSSTSSPAHAMLNARVLISCALSITAGSPALAQYSGSMGIGWTDPPFTRREVKDYSKILGLDETQLDFARTLQEGNRAAHTGLMDRLKDERRRLYEKCRESGNWDPWSEGSKRMEKDRARECEEIETAFLTDFAALLTASQAEHFVDVERMRRREVLMRYAVVAGMGDDVFALLDKAGVEPSEVAGHKAVLDEYAARLDEMLVRLERKLKEDQRRFIDDDLNWDGEKILQIVKPIEDMAKSIRDLNRQTLAQVITGLPDEKRSAIELEVKRRALPKLYRETYTQKALAAAKKLADLAPGQKDVLRDIVDQYERKKAEHEHGVEALMLELEREFGGRISAARRGGWWWGGKRQERMEELKKMRRDLEEGTLTKLEKMLEPSQKSQLPTRSPEPKQNDRGGATEEWGWAGLGEDEEKQ